jgi:hypothetical protein
MARPKSFSKRRDTDFFKDVTELWVQPSEPQIPKQYHAAVNSLVEWAGPDWISNHDSNFFTIRTFLIKSCEVWAVYDWDADARWIAERKQDAKHIEQLDLAHRKFAIALNKAPFRHQRRALGLSFLREFCPDWETEMTNAEGWAAVNQAIAGFAQNLRIRDRAFARYGAIEYAALPKQLPSKEVAIALSLADQISSYYPSGSSRRRVDCPRKPNLTTNLPWKAIEEFAIANSTADDLIIGASSIQTRVASLAKRVDRVYWYG